MTLKTLGKPEADLAMDERLKLREGLRDGTVTPVDQGEPSKTGLRRKLKFDAIKDQAAKIAGARLTGDLFDLEVLEQRRSGKSVMEIATNLERKPEEIKAIIEKCLRLYVQEMAGSVEEVRTLELYRLDGMLEKLWNFRDDPRTVDSILKVMDRRAKLMGLDAAEKSEVKVTGLENMSDEDLAKQLENLALAARTGTPDGGPEGGAPPA